ncbi:P-type ATPase, partial [Mycobacterium kansasii]
MDKLSLLSATKVKVRRDGQTLAIAQDEIVQDDLLLVTRGEQLPVDGLVRETSGLEVDESQITGEA